MDKRSERLIKNLEALLFNLRNKDRNYIHRRLYRFFFNSKFYTKNVSSDTLESLKDERYQPQKNDSVENFLSKILENIFLNQFEENVHSVSGKSIHTALTAIKKEFGQLETFIYLDLSKILETLDLNILDYLLKKKISDERLLRLIHKFIKSGVLELDTNNTYSRTLSGRVLGEILFDIICLPIDRYLNLLGINWIRYRNALLIGIKSDEKNNSDLILEKIRSVYGIRLNPIVKHKKQKILFLEYEIEFKSNNQVFLRVPQRIIKQFILKKGLVRNIDEKPWKSIHRSYLINLSDSEILKIYNTELKNLYLYYSIASNVSQKLGQLKYIMETSCLKTLARKHRTTMNQIKKKYYQEESWGIDGISFYKRFKKRSPSISEKLDKISKLERNKFRR